MTDENENPHIWTGKGIPIYGPLLGDTNIDAIDRLLAFKKRLAIKREEHIFQQKTYAKGKQFEEAKYHSSCAKDIMRYMNLCKTF